MMYATSNSTKWNSSRTREETPPLEEIEELPARDQLADDISGRATFSNLDTADYVLMAEVLDDVDLVLQQFAFFRSQTGTFYAFHRVAHSGHLVHLFVERKDEYTSVDHRKLALAHLLQDVVSLLYRAEPILVDSRAHSETLLMLTTHSSMLFSFPEQKQ